MTFGLVSPTCCALISKWSTIFRVFALKRAGVASLKLHPGRAPHWLVKRMIPMASALCEFVVNEFGSHILLKRLANPVWFQALSNVLGWD